MKSPSNPSVSVSEQKEAPDRSPSHDVDCENSTLMTRQQIIDEIANDGVGFVAELCHNPADQRAAAAMPF